MGNKKCNDSVEIRAVEAPAHVRFREISHAEHRELRDILLTLYAAFDKRNVKRAATLFGTLCDHTGPHFRCEEETLHPLLEDILGKVQVEHLNREHDRTIVDAIYLGEITAEKRLSENAARQGQRLVRRIMPHVSDCDGLAIMVETMAEDEVEAILTARQAALSENISLLDWAASTRPRSFRDTYQRDYHATRRQARGFG